jgi:hypothetical protein
MTHTLQRSSREQRLAKLADEHNVAVVPGSGRFAAIIEGSVGPRLAQADAIGELFALGDVRALVNLDYAASTQDR